MANKRGINATMNAKFSNDTSSYERLYEDYEYVDEIRHDFSHVIKIAKKSSAEIAVAKITEIKSLKERKEIEAFVAAEWNQMKSIKHSNLVNYFDFFSDGHRIYEVTEYCRSGTLEKLFIDRLETKNYFVFDAAFSIFIQILDGLAYLNSRKIILEYLNTSDIYIHKGKLKIANTGKESRKFNVAQLTHNEYHKHQSKRRFYNPPEKLSTLPITIKYDTWCLGCLLYEICTFEFVKDNFKLFTDIELPGLYSRHGFFKNSLKKMMKKDPKERISTVELLEEIVSDPSFIYPNIDITDGSEEITGYQKIHDHIHTKKLSQYKVNKDVYISYCCDDKEHVQELVEKLEKNLKEKKLDVVSNDNKKRKERLDIADEIMNSAVFIVLLTKEYCRSMTCKQDITIAKTAVDNFYVLQIEKFDIDELESAMGTFIKGQKKYLAFPFNPDRKLKDQWVWFDHLVKSIDIIKKVKCDDTTVLPRIEVDDPFKRFGKNDKFEVDKSLPISCFISHKWVGSSPSRPSDFSIQLYKTLVQHYKLRVWYDVQDIPFGGNLVALTQQGIQEATFFLACICDGYASTKSCISEIQYANSRGKPIIVLLMDKIDANNLENGVGMIIANILRFNVYEWPNQKDLLKSDKFTEFVDEINYYLKFKPNKKDPKSN